MNGHRYRAPGLLTNYEMEDVRESGIWREARWMYSWASLSHGLHPRSLMDWHRLQDDEDTTSAIS